MGEHRVDPPPRAPATAEAILDAIEAVRAGVAATEAVASATVAA
ncbi:hypothetical protein GALL_285560 [mine drainage metagenome]|uniref:Uncharacterized protein n=1 Tax=mine drainage metagenome TaxID=410659 RepID=A0A1J5R222_9ZZZZ